MASKFWWLVHKDLVVEYRTRQAWPAMLLLGIIVAVVFNLQMGLPPEQRPAAVGAMLWLAILFAGMVAVERTGVMENQDGCWDALTHYPLPPFMIYLAKLTVNFIALNALACVLVPVFVVLTDVPLLRHAWAMLLVGLLGNVGIAAVATLVSALTYGLRQQGTVLSILVLPLILPVILAAAESTRMIAENELGDAWWNWVQFLGAFAIVFTTLGIALFGFLVED